MTCTIQVLKSSLSEITLDYAGCFYASRVQFEDGTILEAAGPMTVEQLDTFLHLARKHGMPEAWS